MAAATLPAWWGAMRWSSCFMLTPLKGSLRCSRREATVKSGRYLTATARAACGVGVIRGAAHDREGHAAHDRADERADRAVPVRRTPHLDPHAARERDRVHREHP